MWHSFTRRGGSTAGVGDVRPPGCMQPMRQIDPAREAIHRYKEANQYICLHRLRQGFMYCSHAHVNEYSNSVLGSAKTVGDLHSVMCPNASFVDALLKCRSHYVLTCNKKTPSSCIMGSVGCRVFEDHKPGYLSLCCIDTDHCFLNSVSNSTKSLVHHFERGVLRLTGLQLRVHARYLYNDSDYHNVMLSFKALIHHWCPHRLHIITDCLILASLDVVTVVFTLASWQKN